MKTGFLFCVAAGFLCALLSQSGSVARAQTGSSPMCDAPPITYGDFETMRKLRTRAWELFSAVTANRPVFNSPDWVPRQDAFRANFKTGPRPRGVTVFFAAELDQAGLYAQKFGFDASIPPQPLTYESTFFNRVAVKHIQDKEYPLYSKGTTQKLLIGESRREIPEFPKDSIVVKTFWRAVPDQGSVPVGVWTWKGLPEHAVRLFETATWPHPPACVALNPSADSGCLKAKDYFFMTTKQGYGPGFTCLNPILNTCPANLPNGQNLILLGMHIASKENPDWFWATSWWKGVDRKSGASWTCDNAQRPDQLGTGLSSNYSMDVTTSLELKKPQVAADDMETCGSPLTIGKNEELLAAFNPFVEGLLISGRKSSCINCHSRADTEVDVADFSVPQECTYGKPKLELFEGHIRTDYLWSITKFLANTPLRR